MKALLLIMLLPLTCFVSKAPESVQSSEDYTFELTVNSTTKASAQFNLLITGVSLNQNGEKKAFKMQNEHLRTPFKLTLKEGKYMVVVERTAKAGAILSEIQGIKDGKKMGSASDDSKKTILEFGFGGQFSARGE